MFLTRLRAYSRLSAIRLTLGLLLVFVIITGIAWIGTYWLIQREMTKLVDTRLTAQLMLVIEAVEADLELPQPDANQKIMVLGSGRASGGLSFPVLDRPDGYYDYNPGRPDTPDMRYLVRNAPLGRIVIAENVERQEEIRELLAGGMQIALFGTLAVGLLAGIWLARREQKRLDVISEGLAQVARGQLDVRIALPGRADDLSLLADRINATTARLELAMDQMRIQSSNIAHDLRTPLARLRAQLETNLTDLVEKNSPIRAEDLDAALEQIDHLSGTFDALLRLARIESGAGRDAFAPVDLETLVEQVADIYGPVVEDAGQTLRVKIDWPNQIYGDNDLIVQLVANLIQNALRYGPTGQEITLSVQGEQLSVTDQGPGIPFAEREKVLQPLFQLENTRQNAGFGLGLSMVRAISDLHAAQLSLSDGPNGRGLTVTVRFAKLTEL